MKKLVILLLVFLCNYISAQDSARYIFVNGTSELTVAADQIEFNLQIKNVNNSIEESKKLNDISVNELQKILQNNFINQNDIDISPISIGKEYEYIEGKNEFRGYYTCVNVTFTLKDLKNYSSLSNDIAKSSYFDIVSSTYKSSNYSLHHKTANENAVKAAKEKAEYMAQALGSKLGKVLFIEENSFSDYMPVQTNIFNVETRTQDTQGKITLRRSVRIKFELTD